MLSLVSVQQFCIPKSNTCIIWESFLFDQKFDWTFSVSCSYSIQTKTLVWKSLCRLNYSLVFSTQRESTKCVSKSKTDSTKGRQMKLNILDNSKHPCFCFSGLFVFNTSVIRQICIPLIIAINLLQALKTAFLIYQNACQSVRYQFRFLLTIAIKCLQTFKATSIYIIKSMPIHTSVLQTPISISLVYCYKMTSSNLNFIP